MLQPGHTQRALSRNSPNMPPFVQNNARLTRVNTTPPTISFFSCLVHNCRQHLAASKTMHQHLIWNKSNDCSAAFSQSRHILPGPAWFYAVAVVVVVVVNDPSARKRHEILKSRVISDGRAFFAASFFIFLCLFCCCFCCYFGSSNGFYCLWCQLPHNPQ